MVQAAAPRPPADEPSQRSPRATGLLCPFDLEVTSIARFLNTEFPRHPVYDGIELQWFDDRIHGRGLLAFLGRRDDGKVDYYVQPGLHLDRSSFELGNGTGEWTDTMFDVARLDVTGDGVVADVRFTDREGRVVEVAVDDRAAGRKGDGQLLAPFGAAVERPISLLLVHLHGFELVRRVDPEPRITIDGDPVEIGRLPGRLLHRRHLIKYAAPLTAGTLCRAVDGPLVPAPMPADGAVELAPQGTGIAAVHASQGASSGSIEFDPPFPAIDELPAGGAAAGAWTVRLDGDDITGGTWSARRHTDQVELELDVTRRWVPSTGLPTLLRVVTRVLPVFRRWPTTYRWSALVQLGERPHMTSRWQRTGEERAGTYRRVTAG